MAKSKTFLAVREASVEAPVDAAAIEVLDEPVVANNLPTVVPSPTVSIGKIPGRIQDFRVAKQMTIRAVFIEIDIRDIDRCEVQRNGQHANLDDFVRAGDTVLAIPKIRGN